MLTQLKNYYAFGMAYEGSWQVNDVAKDNPYQYNGKELNTDHGLNWSDYGARFYDACVGRFVSPDLLADEAPDWTPYRYGFNNPIVYIDPDGMFETEADAKKYAKDNDIKTSWFSRTFGSGSKITENKDGTWSIDNKKEGSSTFQDKTLADEAHPDGIFTGAMVAATDPMSGSRVTEKGLFGSVNLIGVNTEYRDGSTKFTPIAAGTGPDIGPARGIKALKALPELDATGKLHGVLPKLKDLYKYSKSDLKNLLRDLKISVPNRIKSTVKNNANASRQQNRSHGQRQGWEQDLIQYLEKFLGK